MKVPVCSLLFILPAFLAAASPLREKVKVRVNEEFAGLLELYKHLHSYPEISFQEAKTAQRLGREMKGLGFKVTQNVGGHGVVCVLSNGNGPTVLVRTDTDALPVKEATGLPYASKQTTTDDRGVEVSTMHACGHDVHMTCWVGVAKVLTTLKDDWRGTLLFIAQPAEERGAGARMMLADGLFEKFPVPDYGLALHVSHDQPVGTLGWTSGFAMANVDSVDVTQVGTGQIGDCVRFKLDYESAAPDAPAPSRGRALGPAFRSGELAAGSMVELEQTFLAGQGASIALRTHGGHPVALKVFDGRAKRLCAKSGERMACRWTPPYTQRHVIRIDNPRRAAVRYFISFE